MSSLMQFSGDVQRKGVGLEFYLTTPNTRDIAGLGPIHKDSPTSGDEVELVECAQCKGKHPRLYVAYRKPAGMCGNWGVFRINGKEEVPDLSCPIATFKLPKDAKAMTDEENMIAWHRS